jgi:DnaJ-domain-containing protein 1
LIVDDQDGHRLGHESIFSLLRETEQGATTRVRRARSPEWTARPEGFRLAGATGSGAEGEKTAVETHYERLGVASTAEVAEIKAAYRELARRNHPDLANGSRSADMAAVNEAWRVLSDPERRRAYDATLAAEQRDRERARPPARPRTRWVTNVDDDAPEPDDDVEEDWRLDLPITDGRAVQALGILLAATGALAVAVVLALFAYAILWAG